MSITSNRLAAIALVLVVAASASLVAAQSVASRWKDRDIAADGLMKEWIELTSFSEGVSIAAANDERDLYLAIASSDAQRRRQLLAGGLIVWLDPEGGKSDRFGIQIPGVGFPRADSSTGIPSPRSLDAQDREPPQPDLTYVELIGPGKDDRRRVQLSPEAGIAAGAHVEQGTLLYELKIPLAAPSSTQAYGLGAKLDRRVGLGLQSPKLERPESGRRGGGMGGMGGRGRGGIGGGMGGGRRGGGGMVGRRQPSDLKLWTTITLARAPR